MCASKFVVIRDLEIPRCWRCELNASIASAAAGIGPAIPKGGSASIAASIAAPSGVLASGGPAGTAGVGIGGVPSGSPVGGQYSFTPGGPRIQGGYIVPTAKGTGKLM